MLCGTLCDSLLDLLSPVATASRSPPSPRDYTTCTQSEKEEILSSLSSHLDATTTPASRVAACLDLAFREFSEDDDALPCSSSTSQTFSRSGSSTKRRRILETSEAASPPLTFDLLPPDVVVSHIFRYFRGRLCCSTDDNDEELLQFYSFSLGFEPDGVGGVSPSYFGCLRHLDERALGLRGSVPSSVATRYSFTAEERDVFSLWGYFCRDVFRHPWFLFECLEITSSCCHALHLLHPCPFPAVVSSKMLFSLTFSKDRGTRRRVTTPPPSPKFVHLKSLTLNRLIRLPWIRDSDFLQSLNQLRIDGKLGRRGGWKMFTQLGDQVWNGTCLSIATKVSEDIPETMTNLSGLQSFEFSNIDIDWPFVVVKPPVNGLKNLMESFQHLQELTLHRVRIPDCCLRSSQLKRLSLNLVEFDAPKKIRTNLFPNLDSLRVLSLELFANEMDNFFQALSHFPSLWSLDLYFVSHRPLPNRKRGEDVLPIECPMLEKLIVKRDCRGRMSMLATGSFSLNSILNSPHPSLKYVDFNEFEINDSFDVNEEPFLWDLRFVTSLQLTLFSIVEGKSPERIENPVVSCLPISLDELSLDCYDAPSQSVLRFVDRMFDSSSRFERIQILRLRDPPVSFFELDLPTDFLQRLSLEFEEGDDPRYDAEMYLLQNEWSVFTEIRSKLSRGITARSTFVEDPTHERIHSLVWSSVEPQQSETDVYYQVIRQFEVKWCSSRIVEATVDEVDQLLIRFDRMLRPGELPIRKGLSHFVNMLRLWDVVKREKSMRRVESESE